MGEFRSSTDPKVGRITANNFKHKEVKYSAIKGMAIFEGDIALGKVADIEAVSRNPEVLRLAPQGIVIREEKYRWPNGKIPYHIDPALTQPERVSTAIAHWEAKTKIRFILVNGSNMNDYTDRVYFTAQGGCWSQVGRQGLEQLISLDEGCSVGNAIHEIGHTVGLWHEQSRKDQETYVTINRENITPGYEHNFDQHITDGDDIGEYDYGSLMHYPATAFSKNGLPTIVTKNGAPIGQRDGLSELDIRTVMAIYPNL